MGKPTVEDGFRFALDVARSEVKPENKGVLCFERTLTGEPVWCLKWQIVQDGTVLVLTYYDHEDVLKFETFDLKKKPLHQNGYRYKVVCPVCGNTCFTLWAPDQRGGFTCIPCSKRMYDTQSGDRQGLLRAQINGITMRELWTRIRDTTDPQELIEILEIVEAHITPTSWPWHKQIAEERKARRKHEKKKQFPDM